MSEQVAQREAMQAVTNSDAVTPMGTCSAREAGGSVYGLYPGTIADAHDVGQGTELAVGYHAPTNTVLLTPVQLVDRGDWADFVLGE